MSNPERTGSRLSSAIADAALHAAKVDAASTVGELLTIIQG